MARRLAFSQIKELVAALKYVPKTRKPVAIRNPDFHRVMSKNLTILAWIYNFALMNEYINGAQLDMTGRLTTSLKT